jgi:hypothetical protein
MSTSTHAKFGKVVYHLLMLFIASRKLLLIIGDASAKGKYYEVFSLSSTIA